MLERKIQRHPGFGIVPARINTDLVEIFFSMQRSIGANTNPDSRTYLNNTASIIVGHNVVSAKSNANHSENKGLIF